MGRAKLDAYGWAHRKCRASADETSQDGMMSDRKPPGTRAAYRHFMQIPTRWMDNDAYGHVNNVAYLSFADTAVNRYLLDAGGLDYHRAAVIGLVAETFCRYHRAITYPETVEAGLRVGHLGRTSVRYEIGLFVAGEDTARADAHLVHVWVDRTANASATIPDDIRAALERIKVS
jgi:acyl-CoA thioester hydrolase